MELAQGEFHIIEGKTTENQHDDVRNEERTWSPTNQASNQTD